MPNNKEKEQEIYDSYAPSTSTKEEELSEIDLEVETESPDEIPTADLDKDADKTCRPTWCPSSKFVLKQSEEKILESVKTKYNARYINVGITVGGKKESKIWTVSFNENSKEIPLVLLHGFGAGIGFWALNFDELSQSRPVHAIDLPGFARSSRQKFSSDPEKAENEFVESIEAWRLAMKLDKIILAGHSFGGYLSTCYSIRFPDPVAHLILADPWGFQDKPENLAELERFRNVPFYVKMLVRVVEPLNPLFSLRLAGPIGLGPRLIQSGRADLIAKFENTVEDARMTVSKYIYHCNAQTPTGESAFHSLQSTFGWAKHPLRHRLHLLDQSIPITLIYGARSWVDHYPLAKIKETLPSSDVELITMLGVGHHVYADDVKTFNNIVNRACKKIK